MYGLKKNLIYVLFEKVIKILLFFFNLIKLNILCLVCWEIFNIIIIISWCLNF